MHSVVRIVLAIEAAEPPTALKTGTVFKHDGPLTAAAG